MEETRIENMLSQLITMVGSMQVDQQEMKQEIIGLKKDLQKAKQDVTGLKEEFHQVKHEINGLKDEIHQVKHEINGLKDEIHQVKHEINGLKTSFEQFELKSNNRHEEIIERFKALERDQDFIWEKTARNEREIGNLKRQMG